MALRRPKPDSRKAILAWTAIAIVATGFFPPWLYTFDKSSTSDTAGGHWGVSAGYASLLTPPTFRFEDIVNGHNKKLEDYYATYKARAGVKLDVPRLLVEWVCMLALGGAAWGLVRLNRERSSEPARE